MKFGVVSQHKFVALFEANILRIALVYSAKEEYRTPCSTNA